MKLKHLNELTSGRGTFPQMEIPVRQSSPHQLIKSNKHGDGLKEDGRSSTYKTSYQPAFM